MREMSFEIYVIILTTIVMALALCFAIRIGLIMKGGLIPWTLISTALAIMVVRRALDGLAEFYNEVSTTIKSIQPFVMLIISILFFTGFYQVYKEVRQYKSEVMQ